MLRLSTLALGLMVLVSATGQLDHTTRWPSPLDLADGLEVKSELNTLETYTEANRLIIEENWTEAAQLMEVLFKGAPDNRNFAFKWALCLQAIPGRIQEAVPLVHLAVNGPFAGRYNAFSIDEVLPPEDALELGLEVLQNAYHFSEAKALAEVMTERFSKRDFRHKRALEVMEECDFAAACVLDPVRMEITSMDALNSSSADYAPIVTPDGLTLYFTSFRDRDGLSNDVGQIFRSQRVGATWSRPMRLDLGTPGRDMSTVGIVGDDAGLLAYQGYRKEGGIWKLTRDEYGGWSYEEKLGFPIDSRHWETSMTERFDGWERVFVSNRPGGMGGRDLYRTVKLPDGSWSEPLNLGRRINTSGEEESPVLSADGQTLIFASTGHPGMGGFDLYRCKRLDNGSWSDPEHMGHPLNTPGNEAVLTMDASGNSGFISSARAGGDDLNIYRVDFVDEPGEELAVMIGEVLAWQAGDVMEVRSLDQGASVFRVFRARKGTGKFLAALPPCREYKFSWVRNGETLMERKEAIGCESAYGVGQEVLRLDPFGIGSADPIDTQNVESPGPDVLEETTDVQAVAASTETAGSSKTEWEGDDVQSAEAQEVMPTLVNDIADAPTATAVSVAPDEGVLKKASEEGSEPEGATPLGEPSGTVPEATSPPAPVTMLEFGAVEERIEFGYGQYMSKSGSRELVSMALSIAERNNAGEVPILQIEGSASFVPVKNKRAYESNEQLAKMRAEKARDAMITEMAKRGLQVGIDYQIVLEWGVAGPEYKGDAVEAAPQYKSYQYAKFSLSRTMVEIRG